MTGLFFLSVTCAFGGDASSAPELDSVRIARVRAAVRKDERYADKDDHEIRVSPFHGDVLKVRIYWGQNKDPVPPPFVEYVTPDNRLHASFADALQALKYVPADEDEAVELAALVVGDVSPEAGPLLTDDDLRTAIPEKLRRKHKVRLPDVRTEGADTYRVVIFTYQTARRHSFSSRGRHEELARHTVLMNGHTYTVETAMLHQVDWLAAPKR